MLQLNIGKYTYTRFSGFYKIYSDLQSAPVQLDIENQVKSYDNILHQSLQEIYNERCSSSSQTKKFRHDSQYNKDWKSIIKPILEQEPILSKRFTKEELDKLSLLWIAVLGCYQQSAELLVRSGADVNEIFGRHTPRVFDKKWTVLHVLLQMDPSPENERLSRLIVDHGADLQARDRNGQTVLQLAVQKGRVQITEMLLAKGADVNAADTTGITPLLLAVGYSGKANELVPLLMKYGADIFVKSRQGENALHYLSNVNTDVTKVVDVARALIEKGVSVHDEDNNGERDQPIHVAAMHNHNELVKLYLDHGANINAVSNDGASPLYYAANSGGVTVVETLLARGANIRLKTAAGNTALHAVCNDAAFLSPLEDLENRNKCKSIIRLLLSAGADVLAENFLGRKTPLACILSGQNVKPPGIKLLVKALALKKALQPSIKLKDKKIIKRYQKLKDYYKKCADEIERMKLTRFIDSCTFFELFAKSQCQIATLMRNPDFETKFRFYNLNGQLPIYAEDVVQAFERALNYYRAMLEQENVINEAVYYTLPHLIVNKVVHYALNCSENVKEEEFVEILE